MTKARRAAWQRKYLVAKAVVTAGGDVETVAVVRVPKYAGIRWYAVPTTEKDVKDLRQEGFNWFEHGVTANGLTPYFVKFGKK